MRVLIWHVHGSWTTSFVQGPHTYLVPVVPDRGPDGRGRARTWDWPERCREVTPEALRDGGFDVVVLQRPEDLDLLERWTGRRAGVDVPAVYLEHNTPRGDVTGWRHPMADRTDVPVVHVTPFNAAMWDTGAAPVHVVEHGIPDPGYRYAGTDGSLALCVNEPVRRWRVAGMDLAVRVAAAAPLDLYGLGLQGVRGATGLGADRLRLHEDLPQVELHARMPRQRAYLHPYRWTSHGLSLVEAMTLGMPVLVLSATAAAEVVPPDAGLVTADVDRLTRFAGRLLRRPDEAREMGGRARRFALSRFGLARFLADWDRVLKEAL